MPGLEYLRLSDAFNPRRGPVGITAMLAAKLLKEIAALASA